MQYLRDSAESPRSPRPRRRSYAPVTVPALVSTYVSTCASTYVSAYAGVKARGIRRTACGFHAAVIAVAALALPGCGGGNAVVDDLSGPHARPGDSYGRSNDAALTAASLSGNTIRRRGALLAHLDDWASTPHVLGGTDRSGIDCSAYAAQTYRDVFSLDLPRTTAAQSELGQSVSSAELEPGDLVFFRIESGRHVGVYAGNGEFIHASSSNGVMRSKLSNQYWSRRYWKAKRVLPETLALADR